MVTAGTRGGQEGAVALDDVKGQKMHAGWYTHSTACINSGGGGEGNSASLHWASDDPVPVLLVVSPLRAAAFLIQV